MLGKLSELFLDWKVKLVIISILFISLFAWHKYEVHTAVFEAKTEIQAEYKERKRQLQNDADNTQKELEAKIKLQEEKKNAEIKIANRKYNDLLGWVHNLPSTSSRGDSTINPTNPEIGQQDVIGELRRKHAEEFARYSLRAETVRINLLQCYRQYDEAAKTIEDFKAKHKSN